MTVISLEEIKAEHASAEATLERLQNDLRDFNNREGIYENKNNRAEFDKDIVKENIHILQKKCRKLNGIIMATEVENLLVEAKKISEVTTEMKDSLKNLQKISLVLEIAGSVIDIAEGILTSKGSLITRGVEAAEKFLSKKRGNVATNSP